MEDDANKNLRALDVALNGEQGAATKPLVIDLLSQVESLARKLGKPVLLALAENAYRSKLETARLEWLMRHVSGVELRRLGIITSGNFQRAELDAAMRLAADENAP